MTQYCGKSWLSIDDQIALLKSRGVVVIDTAHAKSYLQKISYYRLSGYAYPFRKRGGSVCSFNPAKPVPDRKEQKPHTYVDDGFQSGVKFSLVIDLYVFDKRLRQLASDALERIEIALRTQIAHTLGEHHPLSYLDATCLHESFTSYAMSGGLSRHHEWVTKQAALITRSKEDFILHHKEKEKLPVPIWVASEVWDFGAMSKLYAGMREHDQDLISRVYGIENGRIFATWLQSLNYLRNVCAHHCRLWNRNIVSQPKLPPASSIKWIEHIDNGSIERTRVFLLLCMCCHMIKIINPNSTWISRLVTLLETLPDLSAFGLSIQNMGVQPSEWKNIILRIKNP